MLDGKLKPVEPMAARLNEGGNRQPLVHFVTASPRRQTSISLHLAHASATVGWRLLVPASWYPASLKTDAATVGCRTKCGIPEEAGHVKRLVVGMTRERGDSTWSARLTT